MRMRNNPIDDRFTGYNEQEMNAMDIFGIIDEINNYRTEQEAFIGIEKFIGKDMSALYDSLAVEMVKLKLFNNGIEIYVDQGLNRELTLWKKDNFSESPIIIKTGRKLISRNATQIKSSMELLAILKG